MVLLPLVTEHETLRGGSFSNAMEEYAEGVLFMIFLEEGRSADDTLLPDPASWHLVLLQPSHPKPQPSHSASHQKNVYGFTLVLLVLAPRTHQYFYMGDAKTQLLSLEPCASATYIKGVFGYKVSIGVMMQGWCHARRRACKRRRVRGRLARPHRRGWQICCEGGDESPGGGGAEVPGAAQYNTL